MRPTRFVFDSVVMNTEAAANAVLTVVALALAVPTSLRRS
jgi:hypothetical protein